MVGFPELEELHGGVTRVSTGFVAISGVLDTKTASSAGSSADNAGGEGSMEAPGN